MTNVIPFPGVELPTVEDMEDVTVLQCTNKKCEGTTFFLELCAPNRVLCSSCFILIKKGW